MSTLPLLFRLPLELRQQIYCHLLPAEPVSHPIPTVGITSVSHRPPSPALLSVHPRLATELQHYYYCIATWKLIFSHAFNFFRTDPTLSNLASWQYLNKIQKVEVVFFCDILLLKEYPSFGVDSFCAEIKRRATRACEVLASAQNIRHVTVSWIDTTKTNSWEEKSAVLEPLRLLADKASFTIGEIIGPGDSDLAVFTKAIHMQLDAIANTNDSAA